MLAAPADAGTQRSVIATADWAVDDAEAVFEALPDAFEYRDDDGADVFIWQIRPRETDVGLYRDELKLGTYAQSLVDEAIGLIDDALGELAQRAGRQVRPLEPCERRAA